MERNIVIFGPAKAGKSTLLGYIYANRTQGFNLEKADSDNRKKLGDNYEETSKYSYIFDTLPDEVLRGHGRGTTRTMKMKKVRINDCEMILIDTPGAEHHYRERVKGMYYGEIGVFMVELLDLTRFGLLDQTNENAIKEFFTPLCLWYGFKDKRRKTIVAISKMDTGPNPFSKKEFNKATKIIKNDCCSAADIPVQYSTNIVSIFVINNVSRKIYFYLIDFTLLSFSRELSSLS